MQISMWNRRYSGNEVYGVHFRGNLELDLDLELDLELDLDLDLDLELHLDLDSKTLIIAERGDEVQKKHISKVLCL